MKATGSGGASFTGTLEKIDVLKVRCMVGFLFTGISPLIYFNGVKPPLITRFGLQKQRPGEFPAGSL
jgi:hypothetical protein